MFENMLVTPQVIPLKGMSAGDAARLFATNKSNTETPRTQEVGDLTKQVMANLKSQGIDADEGMVRNLAEQALKSNVGDLITKATDPVILQM